MAKTRKNPGVYESQRDIPPSCRDAWVTARKLVVHHWEVQGKSGASSTKGERTAFLHLMGGLLDSLLQGWAPYARVLDHLLDN